MLRPRSEPRRECQVSDSTWYRFDPERAAPVLVGEPPGPGAPLAPKNTEELLDAIAEMDYGVSTDRSWSKAYSKAIEAYNAAADDYHQVIQKRGQPLREGFSIVKVCAAVAHLTRSPACISRTISGSHDLRRSHLAHLTRSPACISRTISGSHDLRSCLLYTSPSPRDYAASRMPSSA